MLILVTYDVRTSDSSGRRRLQKIAKCCVNHGQRVQNSVFECLLTPAQYVLLRRELENIMDHSADSLRFYNLGDGWQHRVEHVGAKTSYDPEGPMVV